MQFIGRRICDTPPYKINPHGDFRIPNFPPIGSVLEFLTIDVSYMRSATLTLAVRPLAVEKEDTDIIISDDKIDAGRS